MAVEPELWLGGQPASLTDIRVAAMASYGAITSFQVEQGGVRGLDLHLERLNRSALDLFGQAISQDALLDQIRAALGGRVDAWLRVSLFSPQLTPRNAGWLGEPQAMIAVSPPAGPLADGLRLKTVVNSRYGAQYKHSGQFDLIHARRTAIHAGLDDALFVDTAGEISEGTLWNIGFIKGKTVVFPEAPSLEGVTMRLIRSGLRSNGTQITDQACLVDELAAFDAAFICNSATPCAAVKSIDSHNFAASTEVMDSIRDAWAAQPLQVL